MSKIYKISKPSDKSHRVPVIFDSPHSGLIEPDDFNHIGTTQDITDSADLYVDELFTHVTKQGASLLCAQFPRTYIDVNRAIDDIDPHLIGVEWPYPEGINPTPRSALGIGLIRRLIKTGHPLYNRTLTLEEIQSRIDHYYRPYHAMLKSLIDEAHYNFGQSWHINCHSMPNSVATPKRAIGLIGNQPKPADFVLGDHDGTSCDSAFTQKVKRFLQDLGYSVAINDPFKGVELTSAYAAPERGYHSLQIEINKSLYLYEKTGKKNKRYEKTQNDLKRLTTFVCVHIGNNLIDSAAD